MAFNHVWVFPVLSAIFAFAAFFAGYGIAVGKNDEYPFLSYISDGGAIPPESCVFGQLLNISAMFMAVTFYLRHRQFVEYFIHRNRMDGTSWRRLDFACMILGFAIAFGISMVANFQEGAVPIAHMVGAMTAFFGAVFYVWAQILMAYCIKPRMTPIWLNTFRLLVHLIATTSLVFHIVCQFAQPFVNDVNGVHPTLPPRNHGILKIEHDSPFYTNHIVTTSAEWAMALLLEVLVLSYAWELREFYMQVPKVYVKEKYRRNAVHFDTTPISCLNSFEDFDRQMLPRVKLNDDCDSERSIRRTTFKSSPVTTSRAEYLY